MVEKQGVAEFVLATWGWLVDTGEVDILLGMRCWNSDEFLMETETAVNMRYVPQASLQS